jgi:TonB-linked SusC/RagA family outer membrane protein
LDGFSELRSGSVDNEKNDGEANEYALLSYFGRINYSFMDKYLFEANFRYDGSSRFAKGHKWGAFPSVSAGYRISEEKFWEPFRGIIPNLKLRASWGMLGNENISSYYPFASNVDLTTNYVSNDTLQSGGAITVMSNPDITWETTYMTDFGVDFDLFNKLNVTFDWYSKKTKDILIKLSIPGTIGVHPTYQNAGVVRNIGWDFDLTYTDHISDFKYNIAFNLSDVKNKILDLKGIEGTNLVTNREGYPINSLYMLKSLGILGKNDFDTSGKYLHEPQYRNLAPGDLRYADIDGNGIVNDMDREVLGSTIPRFTYGFSLFGSYKGFDLNILLQGVAKVDGYLTGIESPFYSGGTIFEFHKDRWTTDNPNPNATFPRLYFGDSNNYRPSDFYLKSAAYLRLKNFQFGYTIPSLITKKFDISSLRIYFVAENLFTITSFWDGWDPESPPGTNGQFYPQVKNIGFGIDLKF